MTTGHAGFSRHNSFVATENGFRLTTVAFETHANLTNNNQNQNESQDRDRDKNNEDETITVTVRVPTLAAATADEIAPIVADDWRRTLRRRLKDAPGALPARPTLEEFALTRLESDNQLEIVYRLSPGGADVTKAVAEYVEGTYVETTIPGYEYEPPVSGLLASARASGSGSGEQRDADDAQSR